mgnify:CR=1 FL=1
MKKRKRILAGSLGIECDMPVRQRGDSAKERAAKSRATSAAQKRMNQLNSMMELELRLAALLLEAEAPAQVLSSLRSSAAVRESVVFLVENAKMDTSDLPKVLCRHTRPQIEALLQLQQALHPADPQPAAQAAALAQIPPVTLQTLAVSGADLIAQGHKPGAALGQTLQALLYTVLSRQVPNEKSALLALCAKLH